MLVGYAAWGSRSRWNYAILFNVGKDLYILAGANGSGKSTIAKVLLPNDFVLVAHGNGAVNVVASERYNKFMEGLCLK